MGVLLQLAVAHFRVFDSSGGLDELPVKFPVSRLGVAHSELVTKGTHKHCKVLSILIPITNVKLLVTNAAVNNTYKKFIFQVLYSPTVMSI